MKNVKKIIASIVTLALVGSTVLAIPASAEVQDSYTISLQGAVGDTQHWDADAPSVNVTGDGDYSLVFTLDSATESKSGSGALIMETDINPFDFVEEGAEINDIAGDTGINITVSSVVVDAGTESEKVLDYSFNSGSYRLNDNGNAIRLNIYNTWGNDCTDLDFNFSANTDITVNFTVSGLTDAISKAKGETSDGQPSDTVADTDATEGEGAVTTVEDLVPGDSNGDTSSVSDTNKPSTSTSEKEEEKTVDYKLYEKVIDAAGKVVSDKGYNKLSNENGKLGYYLFDINDDGVKELIIAEDFSETMDGTTKLVSGYYDVYTIVDGEVVEINQLDDNGEKILAVAANGYLSIEDDARVAVLDGKLVYVRTKDGTNEVDIIYVTGYTGVNKNLKLTWLVSQGVKDDYNQVTLYDYTDKTPIGGEKGDGDSDGSETTTTAATTTNSSSENPGTGDAGIGTVAIAFAVAGLSAVALRKKD